MNNILQWNLQSFYTKFSELKVLIKEYQPICICLQETRIKDDASPHPPSGYHLIKSPRTRNDGHERGTAVLVNRNVNFEPIDLDTNLQAVAVKLLLNKTYTVCSIYLPFIDITKRDLSNLIAQLEPPFLLLGDMNAHNPLWGSNTINNRGRIFEQLLLEWPISLLNNGNCTHFHIQTNTYSNIDLSICSSDCITDFEYNIDDNLHDSDHYPILLSLLDAPALGDRPDRLNIEKADWKTFKERSAIHEQIDLNCSANELFEGITSHIMDAASIAIPLKRGTRRRIPVPWWNGDCREAYRERKLAERALKRNNNLVNKIRYNRARAKCRFIFNNARKSSWELYVSSINENVSQKEIWKKVKKITGKFRPTPAPVLKTDDGRELRTDIEVANELSETFAAISKVENYSVEFQNYKRRTEQRNINFRSSELLNYNECFTMSEYRHVLSQTTETAPGSDGITYSMLKNCHESLTKYILDSFNRIYCENIFPDCWRTAVVIPILKPNKDPAKATSYRPISLTSCLCKLLEKMINIRLMWYLEQNRLLSSCQSGFRRLRSTTDHLVTLENDLQNAILQKKHTIAVFFDLTKAYDTAWKHGILLNLHRYGLRGNLPLFIQNFLNERKIAVQVGRAISESKILEEGTPQGSVLSCSCFMIAIDSISSQIPSNVESLLYVDDFTIYTSSSFPAHAERRLQSAINSLYNWTKKTGFSFSPSKTVSLHICRKRGCSKLNANLSLNNIPITTVEQHKFLGLIFDNSLTWRPHIKDLKISCNRTLDLLKHISHRDWGAGRSSLLRLYMSLLKPKLDYGSEAYSSACPSLLQSLSPIQNSAIRIATGAFRSSPVISLHAESGLKPLEYYRDIKILNTFLRIIANPHHPLHEAAEEELYLTENDPSKNSPKSFLRRAVTKINFYHLDFYNIMNEFDCPEPPWQSIERIEVCTELYEIKKKEITPQGFRNAFYRHFSTHPVHPSVFTDGSKTETGVAYAYSAAESVFSVTVPPVVSNFSAELMAISDGLQHLREHSKQDEKLIIVTDSRSCVQALTKYNNRNPLVISIQSDIGSGAGGVVLCWVPSHIGITENEQVDSAARRATEGEIQQVPIPRMDYKIEIHKAVKSEWYREWESTSDNKLKEIVADLSMLNCARGQSRRWLTIVTRLLIGHTKITHGHLMEGGPAPFCDTCTVPLTVKHLLTTCSKFSRQRREAFNAATVDLKTILANNVIHEGGPLYKFIHRTNLHKDI